MTTNSPCHHDHFTKILKEQSSIIQHHQKSLSVKCYAIQKLVLVAPHLMMIPWCIALPWCEGRLQGCSIHINILLCAREAVSPVKPAATVPTRHGPRTLQSIREGGLLSKIDKTLGQRDIVLLRQGGSGTPQYISQSSVSLSVCPPTLKLKLLDLRPWILAQ